MEEGTTPEAGTLELSEAEIAARLDNMRAAIASARIEGAEVSAGTRSIMELYNRGHIDADEMIRRIHVRHDAAAAAELGADTSRAAGRDTSGSPSRAAF